MESSSDRLRLIRGGEAVHGAGYGQTTWREPGQLPVPAGICPACGGRADQVDSVWWRCRQTGFSETNREGPVDFRYVGVFYPAEVWYRHSSIMAR